VVRMKSLTLWDCLVHRQRQYTHKKEQCETWSLHSFISNHTYILLPYLTLFSFIWTLHHIIFIPSLIHTYILDILFSYKDWLFHFFWVCLLGPLITTKIAFLFVFVFGCFMVSLFFVPILNLCTFFSYNIFLFCSILLN
jgi:hypothetical protein